MLVLLFSPLQFSDFWIIANRSITVTFSPAALTRANSMSQPHIWQRLMQFLILSVTGTINLCFPKS